MQYQIYDLCLYPIKLKDKRGDQPTALLPLHCLPWEHHEIHPFWAAAPSVTNHSGTATPALGFRTSIDQCFLLPTNVTQSNHSCLWKEHRAMIDALGQRAALEHVEAGLAPPHQEYEHDKYCY